MPILSTILALLALTAAGVVALVLARTRERVHFLGALISWVPSLLMLVAFLTDVSGRRILVAAAAMLSVVFFSIGLLGVRLLAQRPGALSFGGLYGVITVVGLLYTFGSLLQVRLDYQRNPNGGSLGGVDGDVVREFLISQGTPLIVLATAVTSVGAQPYWVRLGRHIPRRVRATVVSHPRAVRGVGAAIIVGTFFLPMLGPTTNGAHLTFLGIQFSEWMRPLWILVVAYLLARYRHYVNWRSVVRGEPGALVLAGSLVFLVAGVAVAGWVRSDFGMVLPLVFAVPAMTVVLARQDREAWLSSMGPQDSMAVGPRVGRGSLAVLALLSIGALLLVDLTVPGLKGRLDVWQNPWQFAWTIECTPTRNVPDWISPGRGYTDPVPAGYELCIELQADANASANSQTAKALTAIDGGGIWGRGLSDTEAGIVPVRSSDFILAAVWSKFGGLTVLLSTLLVTILGYLLTRRVSLAPWEGYADSRGDRARLYAAGLGAMIAGQAVYVLLATTNLVWLTGVPYPFLARGGQAMGGLVLGTAVLIWLVQRTDLPGDSRSSHQAATLGAKAPLARRPRLAIYRSAGLWLAAGASVGALVAGIAIPFASWQARKLDAGLGHVGVQKQLRSRGLAPLLKIDGEAAFAQQRATGSWFTPDGVKAPLELNDLFGVLRTSPGTSMGMLEGTEEDPLQVTIGRTILDRLRETPAPRRVLDITVKPTLQSVVARAVRAPVVEGHRLPAGAVVINASSGAIQALSTAPDEPNSMTARASDAEVEAWYDPELHNSAWGRYLGDKSSGVVRAAGEVDCSTPVPCGRYQLRAVADPLQDEEYLRTFVGGDAAFDLPNPAQNRAVGRYNLGSTFKIVVAAAYLEAGGEITDRIASPTFVEVGGKRIGPQCRGTSHGKITVAKALQVSCNPAFIQLARTLGWAPIKAVATKLGFKPIDRLDAETDKALWPATPHIPATVDHESIGTNAIGGDLVASTPLHMAAVMAAIADGGTYRDPYLVASRLEDDGRSTSHEADGAAALSPKTARQLQVALAEVAGDGGTLADVKYDKARVRFYGKSGTHIARKKPDARHYATRYFWIVGAAEKVQGGGEPIAFAIVVEGRDPKLGRTQVRALAAEILRSYAE